MKTKTLSRSKPRIGIPCQTIKCAGVEITFTRATVKEDRKDVVELLAHWPDWALKALGAAVDDLRRLSTAAREKLVAKSLRAEKKRLLNNG
jgi:hypothetical protein